MESLKSIVTNFVKQLNAISEFSNIGLKAYQNNLDEFEKGTDERAIIDSSAILTRMIDDYKNDPESFLIKMNELKKESKKDFFPDEMENDAEKIIHYLVDKFSSEHFIFKFDGEKLSFHVKEYQRFVSIIEVLERSTTLMMHLEMSAQSSLITLTNCYEYMINRIFHHLIYNKPESVDFDKKTLTFEELKRIGTIEEAKERLVFEMVNEFMRKSNTEWLKSISKSVNNNARIYAKLENEAQLVDEMFQRRNIIVHNGGVVNEYYISNVSENFRNGKNKGDKIEVDQNYISKSVSNVFNLGIKFIFYYWQNIEPNDHSERFSVLQDIAYKKLNQNILDDAKLIYELLGQDKNKFNGQEKLLHCVNYAQALKWSNNQKFKDLVKDTDFSLAKDEHLMCLALLNDDYSNAVYYLEKLIDSPDPNTSSDLSFYTSWPIFREFKKTNEFKQFADKKGYEEIQRKS